LYNFAKCKDEKKTFKKEIMINISDLSAYYEKEVIINGWLVNSRSSKGIEFLVLRDGTGFLQCIVDEQSANEGVYEKAKSLTQESSVELTGKVVKDNRQIGGVELQVSDIKIIHLNKDEYPISNKAHGVEFLMNNRHLWLRSKSIFISIGAIVRRSNGIGNGQDLYFWSNF